MFTRVHCHAQLLLRTRIVVRACSHTSRANPHSRCSCSAQLCQRTGIKVSHRMTTLLPNPAESQARAKQQLVTCSHLTRSRCLTVCSWSAMWRAEGFMIPHEKHAKDFALHAMTWLALCSTKRPLKCCHRAEF